VLHACDASIHGTIHDTAGGVIPGAVVSQSERVLTTSAGTEANSKGDYELCVPVGGGGVVVKADGYAAIYDRVSVFGRTRRDFVLIPGTTLVGRVVRAGDRSAIAGAVVELRPKDPREEGALLSASSDVDGRFHFDGVAPGRHEITARAESLATPRPVEVIAEIGRPPQDVVCELAATRTVSGKVIERGSGTPLAGTTVYLYSLRQTRMGAMGEPIHAITQSDGSFVIDHVLPGEYFSVVPGTNDRDEPAKLKVEGADVSGVVIEIEPSATISGRILLSGKPIDGAIVRVGNASTASSHDGRYTLRGLAAGTYQIYAESFRVGAFTRSPSITIAKREQRTDVDVELDMSASIAGVVVDQNDAPVSGVFLMFSLLRGQDFGQATTAEDGSFIARGLSGGGDYIYEVRERDGTGLSYSPAGSKRYPPIAVRDGHSHITGMRAKIRLERLSIAGRVTDSSGKPVSDVSVRVMPNENAWYRMPTATTDERGAFTIRDLRAGTYTLQASAARGGNAHEDKVAAGRTDVAIRLVEPGGIDGVLEGFVATPEVIAYSGEQFHAAVTGNTFQFRNLPAGEYRLVATSSVETEYASVIVTPGATKTVTLRKREGGVIVGIVVDEKSRVPLGSLYCTSSRRGLQYENGYGYGSTDATGAFRIERAPVGVNDITCSSETASASGEATVIAGQVTRVDLTASPHKAPQHGHAGLTLEDQLGEAMVKTVEPGGPAARAGIVVGDVLQKVDDTAIGGWGSSDRALSMIEYHPIDKPVKLSLERGEKELTVTLTLDVATP
jgi:protocatechuate 3,4-dioxygenase beta subunit